MSEELKPCPFCGDYDGECAKSGVPDMQGNPKFAVYCNGCFSEGPPAMTEAEAIAAWNRRASPAEQAAPTGEAGGWQPIETAPKDGRIVLYWVASVRHTEEDETGARREIDVSLADFGCWMPGGQHGEGYHDPFGGIPGDQGGVTHWMPTPAPPSTAPRGAGGEG